MSSDVIRTARETSALRSVEIPRAAPCVGKPILNPRHRPARPSLLYNLACLLVYHTTSRPASVLPRLSFSSRPELALLGNLPPTDCDPLPRSGPDASRYLHHQLFLAAPHRSRNAHQDPSTMATQASHPFTCNTCQVAFRASELQRAHMQTDWQ